MRLIARLLRVYFDWLYHGLAFTYDLTAWTISFGQWSNWIKAVVPFIEGTRVLELGHGPGHLQRLLRDRATTNFSTRTATSPDVAQSRETLDSEAQSFFAFGLDESPQMGRLARRRLLRAGHAQANLTRGLAQALPFPTEAFDTIVATFPAEYIFEAQTASEARRVLRNGGRLIVMPVAWPKNRFLGWLYRVTHEAPSEALNVVKAKISQPFINAGFETRIELHDVKSSGLLIVLARKPA